jgi:hypothetical protein
VINFRGVVPVFVPAVWKLITPPPGVQFFLWLLSKDKILTRDNLDKRRNVADASCLFCGEMESVTHLFFECVVAKRAWEVISGVLGVKVGFNYESVANLWLCNKKYGICNIFTSALCWSLCKLRNGMCFQGVAWVNIRYLWYRVVPMIRSWRILVPLKLWAGFDSVLALLERMAAALETLPWRSAEDEVLGGAGHDDSSAVT